MTRELSIHRRPLREREQPISSDVAAAIESLVARESELPAALTKMAIVDRLIEMAHEEEDGTIAEITPIARRAMTDLFVNRLTNTSVFQAGYKHYEEKTTHPVVPVTDFFFKNVFGNGNAADCLDAMSTFEIAQSLPKRRSRMRADEDGDFVRGENGEILQSGEISGIVVFPQNSHADLQRVWLGRLANTLNGHLEKTVKSIEHARPDTMSVSALKEFVAPIKPALRKALPRPRNS